MYEEPPSSLYPDLVKLAGGPEPVVRLAQEKLDGGKPVEALYLTDVVLASDEKNRSALGVRIKTLQYLRDHCENYVEDGWLEYGIRKANEKFASE
jgi:Alkyl sulfatase dimerisation